MTKSKNYFLQEAKPKVPHITGGKGLLTLQILRDIEKLIFIMSWIMLM